MQTAPQRGSNEETLDFSQHPDTPVHECCNVRLQASLQPGDVRWVEGHSRVNTAIEFLTQPTWSHAARSVGALAGRASGDSGAPRCGIEADWVDRVRALAPSRFADLHARVCRPASLPAADVQRVVEHAVARIADQYDLRHNLVRYLVTTPPVPLAWRRRLLVLGSGDPTRAIRSTLIAQAFASVEYPILPSVEQRPRGDPLCPACIDEILHVRHHCL